MLVLTRRIDESIMIGNEIVVTVLEVRGDQVRIGIQAPRSIQVHREEVFREIETQNAQAARSAERALAAVARMPGGRRLPPRTSGEAPRTSGETPRGDTSSDAPAGDTSRDTPRD